MRRYLMVSPVFPPMSHVGAKYNGLPIPTETPEQSLKAAAKRVTVRIKPVDIYSWDHGKLGGVY